MQTCHITHVHELATLVPLQVPAFNAMYELYDPCTIMFFFRNKHIMIDLGTGNNNKINWAMTDKQEFIDIVETVYRGARKGRGLVVSPKGVLRRPPPCLKFGPYQARTKVRLRAFSATRHGAMASETREASAPHLAFCCGAGLASHPAAAACRLLDQVSLLDRTYQALLHA